jgi:hypothetical protein
MLMKLLWKIIACVFILTICKAPTIFNTYFYFRKEIALPSNLEIQFLPLTPMVIYFLYRQC